MNDVMINKVQSIQRCVKRAIDEYELAGERFRKDFSRQDACLLNLLRACEQSIDLANHLVKKHKLGIPTQSTDSFEFLEAKGLPEDLSLSLQKMVGFRNTLVHSYQKLQIEIVESLMESRLADLKAFTEFAVRF